MHNLVYGMQHSLFPQFSDSTTYSGLHTSSIQASHSTPLPPSYPRKPTNRVILSSFASNFLGKWWKQLIKLYANIKGILGKDFALKMALEKYLEGDRKLLAASMDQAKASDMGHYNILGMSFRYTKWDDICL